MWICACKHGPAPQESTLPLTKTSLAAFPGVAALQSAEVSQLWCLGVPGVAPRVLYTAAVCTYVFALLVAVKVRPRMLAAEQHGHPCTFWNVPLAGPFLGLWACMLFVFLHCVLCMWNQHPGTKRKKTWMKNNLSQLNAFFNRRQTHIPRAQNWGHKFGSWAGLLIFVLWPHFWVQNLAPVLGPQNTNRSYSIRAANVLLPPQADSSTYPWYCMYLYIHIHVPNIYIYKQIHIVYKRFCRKQILRKSGFHGRVSGWWVPCMDMSATWNNSKA